MTDKPKKKTGFAAMTPLQRAAAGAKGARKAWELGRAHKFTKAEAKKYARAGGLASAATKKETAESAVQESRAGGDDVPPRGAT